MSGVVFVCPKSIELKYGQDLPYGCHCYTVREDGIFTYEGPEKMHYPSYHVKKWKMFGYNSLLVFNEESWRKAALVRRKKHEQERFGWDKNFSNYYHRDYSKSPLKGECYGAIFRNEIMTFDYEKPSIHKWIQKMTIKYGSPFFDKEELSRLHLEKTLGPTWVRSTTNGFAPSPTRYICKKQIYSIPSFETLEQAFNIYKTLGLTKMFSFSRLNHKEFLERYVCLYTDRYML